MVNLRHPHAVRLRSTSIADCAAVFARVGAAGQRARMGVDLDDLAAAVAIRRCGLVTAADQLVDHTIWGTGLETHTPAVDNARGVNGVIGERTLDGATENGW